MNRYTLEQRIQIVKIHYTSGENFANTVRKTRSFFGSTNAPSRNAIVNLINKFERLGQVTDERAPTRARSARSTEIIAAVAESVAQNPGLSMPKRSQELGISFGTLHRILHKDLGLPSRSKDQRDGKNSSLPKDLSRKKKKSPSSMKEISSSSSHSNHSSETSNQAPYISDSHKHPVVHDTAFKETEYMDPLYAMLC